MTRAAVDLVILSLLCVAAVALMLKLFWPKARHPTDASDNWAQHNELRSPSLEKAAGVADSLSPVDVAIGLEVDSGGAN
jgi:hypothetical protein